MNDLAVLIPAYNDGPALKQTLDSISEADNRFTVVVVDDGSRPPIDVETGDYPFAIRILRLEHNVGIAHALTAGDDLCHGGFRPHPALGACDDARF